MARQSRSGRIQAFVDLMDKPAILAAREPEAFERALHYESELRDWFRIYPGWHLERNREMIRLVRTPSVPVEGFSLPGLKDRLDYLLFTLVLHFAEVSAARGGVTGGAGDRFLLSLLAEDLLTLVQNRYGTGVLDFGEQAHRRSLVRVMQALERFGALHRLDGSAGEWAEHSASADGLYAFTEVVYQLVPGAVPAAVQATPTEGELHPLQPPLLPGADPDQRAWRALLLGPALYAADDPAAFAVMVRGHGFFARELFDLFEYRLDIRQGMARVLRETHAQDAGYVMLTARLRSDYGPVLLLCNLLRQRVEGGAIRPDPHGGVRMSYSQFCTILVDLRDEHRDLLAGGLGTCSSTELIDRTLSLMRENGMLRGPDSRLDIYLLPVCALYSGSFAAEQEPAPMEETPQHEQLRLFT